MAIADEAPAGRSTFARRRPTDLAALSRSPRCLQAGRNRARPNALATPLVARHKFSGGDGRSPRRLASTPQATKLLRRCRHTPPQFSLPPSERKANVRGAFAIRLGYHLEQASVLLVDDILTTGSTCSEAARALKRAGLPE